MLWYSISERGPIRDVKSSRRSETHETRVRASTSAARGSSRSSARSLGLAACESSERPPYVTDSVPVASGVRLTSCESQTARSMLECAQSTHVWPGVRRSNE